jgi:hypothetical protein
VRFLELIIWARIESRFVRVPRLKKLQFNPPMMPTLVDEPPAGRDWIHEVNMTATDADHPGEWYGARLYPARPRLDRKVSAR